jgi:hypothetical protein
MMPNQNPAKIKISLNEKRFVKQNANFEKSQELKGLSEKFKNE